MRVIGLKTGENFSALEIEKTDKLQALHEELTKKLEPYMEEKVMKEAFVEPININELTLDWVNNFREDIFS